MSCLRRCTNTTPHSKFSAGQNPRIQSETGTSRTFERRQTTIQVAAIDVEHQSFICFEATSNQFHPSRLQANHVAEGRRRAKSIWREEVTYRRVEGGEVDMRMDRSAVGKDKMNKKKQSILSLKMESLLPL